MGATVRHVVRGPLILVCAQLLHALDLVQQAREEGGFVNGQPASPSTLAE